VPSVGQVLGIKTKNVIGKDSAFKWHFCICASDRLYLYVCSRGYDGDFEITNEHCPGLHNAVSYISLSRLIHVPDVKMRKARHACTADTTYLQQFWHHVIDVDVLSERDRSIIVGGLERHFRNRIK
jgi:hypothetical protein